MDSCMLWSFRIFEDSSDNFIPLDCWCYAAGFGQISVWCGSSQSAFTRLNLTIETLEQGVK